MVFAITQRMHCLAHPSALVLVSTENCCLFFEGAASWLREGLLGHRSSQSGPMCGLCWSQSNPSEVGDVLY